VLFIITNHGPLQPSQIAHPGTGFAEAAQEDIPYSSAKVRAKAPSIKFFLETKLDQNSGKGESKMKRIVLLGAVLVVFGLFGAGDADAQVCVNLAPYCDQLHLWFGGMAMGGYDDWCGDGPLPVSGWVLGNLLLFTLDFPDSFHFSTGQVLISRQANYSGIIIYYDQNGNYSSYDECSFGPCSTKAQGAPRSGE